MTINKRIGIGILLLVLIVCGAYLFEHVTKVQGRQNGKLVPVIQHDKTTAYLDAGVIRQLSQQERDLNKEGEFADNEVSLSFALGSAGVTDYQYIEVSGVGDNEDVRLSPRELDGVSLSSNNNNTFAMVNKADGNRVMIKEVTKFYVAN